MVQWGIMRISRMAKNLKRVYWKEIEVMRVAAFEEAATRRDFSTMHRLGWLLVGFTDDCEAQHPPRATRH